ncbi:MAG TPA: flagellar basal body rod protein FlgC, partial [Oceanipulchritudo sp.]|nr:flagellar basal body rod protein FlgC [Oceanipulchritudo sp.]
GIQASASALQAHQTHLEAIAQNLANAQTTRTADGNPYQRQVVSFASFLDGQGNQSVRVTGIQSDTSPGSTLHNPGHPHAGADGMLRMPNVSASVEMVDMISASRAYEANLTAAKTARQMAERALEIGR